MEVLGLVHVEVPIWAFLIVLLIVGLYLYGTWPYSTLSRLGIPHPPVSTFFGNSLQQFKADSLGGFDLENRKKYGKVWGMYEFRIPTVVFHDPDDLKQLLIKQFHNFPDRRDMGIRGILKHSLFDENGADWKRMRSLVTPFFTTGKLKQKAGAVNRCCDNLVAALGRHLAGDNCWEAKSVASYFAMDSIASTGFGLELDSASDPDDPYVVHGRLVDQISGAMKWFLVSALFPFLRMPLEAIGITMFPPGLIEFFTETTYKAIEQNRSSKEKRKVPDFIDSMLKAHIGELDLQSRKDLGELTEDELAGMRRKGLSQDEMVGNSLILFLAGFDTTGTALSFFMYLLATNPECQERAYQEAVEVIGEGVPDYDSVSKLEYIEMCMNETLRLFPPVLRFDRQCRQDAQIGGVTVPEGALVSIPAWALHHDPEYWPDPEKFDPERFSAETTKQRNPYVFHPFGHGPRMCIGSRLAIMDMKMAVAKVLLKYKLVTNDKTENPIELKKQTFFIQTKNGAWLSVEPRKTNEL